MKLSFCSIAFRNTDEPLTAIIPRLAAIGYDGVEIWANHLRGDCSDIDTIISTLNANKIAVPMISPYFNVTGGPNDWETTQATAQTVFEYAAALGAPLIRVFTGFLGSDEIDQKLEEEAVRRLGHLCDMAGARGLELALETHPRTLVDNVPAIHRLLAAVDRPNLGLNLDIYHMWEKHQDPLWIWQQLKASVRHIHAKNALIPPSNGDDYPLFHDKQGKQEIDGVTFLASGNMDYAPFLGLLAQESFDGWVSIEWFGPDPIPSAARELTWIKNAITAASNENAFT